MKPTYNSFLFFCFFILFFTQKHEAQNTKDSLGYYVEFIKNSKRNDDLIEAISYLKRENITHKQNNHILGLVYNHTYIAKAERKIGLLYEGEISAVKALKLLDQIEGDTNAYRIPLYNLLGILYFEHEDFESSLKYYNLVLERNNNSKHRVTIFNNIGKVYFEKKNYDEAIRFYKKSFDLSLLYNNKLNTARARDNLGFAQSKIFNSEALHNLTEALEIRRHFNYKPGIIESYLHLGTYHKDRNDAEKALDYANKALQIADSTKNRKFKKAALKFFTNLSNDERVLELNKLNDEIEKDDKLQSNKFASQRYNLEKANEKINAIEIENEKHKRNNIIYLLILLFIVSLSICFRYILKAKHKKDKIKQVYLKETELSKKVHDELANDMSDLMNFVENDIEVAEIKKNKLLDNIEDIYLRTRDISTETGSINLVDFSESIKHLLMQHNRQNTKVVINDINTVDWQHVADHKKMVLFRCLQELMVNMKKHSKAKVVSVVFKAHKNKNEIRYVDDGVGFENEGVKRNGLLNAESRIKSIGGSFNFTTSKGKGFKATLEFNS